MSARAWLVFIWAAALAEAALPPLSADTTCTVPEEKWFKAELCRKEITTWAQLWFGPQDLDLVDAFSASQGLEKLDKY